MRSAFRLYFSRRWWWSTLLMLAAVAVMIALGFWQLGRMQMQDELNAHLLSMQAATTIDLNAFAHAGVLTNLEYRRAVATGTLDFGHQVALRNQYWGDPDGAAMYGFHLLTPLILAEGQAVLVDRGWIPADHANPNTWSEYDESVRANVNGILRVPILRGELWGSVADPTAVPSEDLPRLWNYLDVARIESHLPYRLLPVYLQQAPLGTTQTPPYKALPVMVPAENTHLGYALQWFGFAMLVLIGYPVFLSRQKPTGA